MTFTDSQSNRKVMMQMSSFQKSLINSPWWDYIYHLSDSEIIERVLPLSKSVLSKE